MSAVVLLGLAGFCAFEYEVVSNTFQVTNTISDPRACSAMGDNNVDLSQAASELHLKIPADAGDLEFNATVDVFGDLNLDVRFTTTPENLATFVEQSGLPPLVLSGALDNAVLVDTFPHACGLTPPQTRPLYFAKNDDSSITLVVDQTNPSHPVVYVDALDV